MNARDRIKQTLAEMLSEQPFQKLQVAQIVERANVSRATFYLHFRDKEELLLTYVDELFQVYFEQNEPFMESIEHFNQSVAEAMFMVFKNEEQFSAIFLQDEVQPILYGRFQGYISRIFGRLFRGSRLGDSSMSAQELEFMMSFCAGASLAVLRQWVKSGFEPNAREMGALYFKLIMDGARPVIAE